MKNSISRDVIFDTDDDDDVDGDDEAKVPSSLHSLIDALVHKHENNKTRDGEWITSEEKYRNVRQVVDGAVYVDCRHARSRFTAPRLGHHSSTRLPLQDSVTAPILFQVQQKAKQERTRRQTRKNNRRRKEEKKLPGTDHTWYSCKSIQ